MSEKKTVLTHDGLLKREEELQELKTIRRKEVAEKIKEARSQGDLSENSEYDAAKEEQAEIEARIVALEKLLRNAEVIDEEDIDRAHISVGTTAKVLDCEFKEEIEYTIVGSAEADPFLNKISNESPLGSALIGKSVGMVAKVEAPDGVLEYRVIEIK